MNLIKSIFFVLFLITKTTFAQELVGEYIRKFTPEEEWQITNLAKIYFNDPQFNIGNKNISLDEFIVVIKEFICKTEKNFIFFTEKFGWEHLFLYGHDLNDPNQFAKVVAAANILEAFLIPMKELEQQPYFEVNKYDYQEIMKMAPGTPVELSSRARFINFYTSLSFWERLLSEIINHIIITNKIASINGFEIPFPEEYKTNKLDEIFTSYAAHFNMIHYVFDTFSLRLGETHNKETIQELFNVFRSNVKGYNNSSLSLFAIPNDNEKTSENIITQQLEFKALVWSYFHIYNHNPSEEEMIEISYIYHRFIVLLVDNWLRYNTVKESVFIKKLLGANIYKSFMEQFSNHGEPRISPSIEIEISNKLVSAWLRHIKVSRKQKKKKAAEFILWLKHNKDALESFNLHNAWLKSTDDKKGQDIIFSDFVTKISELKGVTPPVKKAPEITVASNKKIVKKKKKRNNQKRKSNKTTLAKEQIERTSFVQPEQPVGDLPKGGEKPKRNKPNKRRKPAKRRLNTVNTDYIISKSSKVEENKEQDPLVIENYSPEIIDNKESNNTYGTINNALLSWLNKQTSVASSINEHLKDEIWIRVLEIFNLVRAIKKEIPVLKNNCQINSFTALCLSDEAIKKYNKRFYDLIELYETTFGFKPKEAFTLINGDWKVGPKIDNDSINVFNNLLLPGLNFDNHTNEEIDNFLTKIKQSFFEKRQTPRNHLVNQFDVEIRQRSLITGLNATANYDLFNQPYWSEQYSEASKSTDIYELNFEIMQMYLFDAELWVLEKTVGALILGLLGQSEINYADWHRGIASLDIKWLSEWLKPFRETSAQW